MEKENKTISIKEARQLVKQHYKEITKQTMYDWCRGHDIGEKIAGQWRVNRLKLLSFLGVENEQN